MVPRRATTAALVEELRELGLRFETGEEERPVEGPLTGQTYVITGTLERFTREEAAARLEALGAKVGELASRRRRRASIVGEEPGKSKLTKAEKAGVPHARPRPTCSRYWAAASTVANRSCATRAHDHEIGPAVLQDRERRSGRPRSRRAPTRSTSSRSSRGRRRPRRCAACGRRAFPSAPGDRQRRQQLEADLEVVPHRREQRRERRPASAGRAARAPSRRRGARRRAGRPPARAGP